MSFANIFSLESDTIEISELDTLIALLRYQPHHQDNFLNGLLLAKDLISDKGVTLYTNGTTITPDRIARLIEIHDMNPAFEMNFKIKRSPELIETFKSEIIKKFAKLLAFRSKYKLYSIFLNDNKETLITFFDQFLNSEARTLTTYRMKFTVETSPYKNAVLFYNHALSLALFSHAIVLTPGIKEKLEFTPEDLEDLLTSAIFYCIGSIFQIEVILKEDPKNRLRVYHEANRNSPRLIKDLSVPDTVLEVLKYVNDFNSGARDFIHEDGDKICMMANIITIADIYLQGETGLLDRRITISHVIDQLNVEALKSKLNNTVVKALTIALKFKDIFDFYQEIDRLVQLCAFDGGNHGLPYPMAGLKSPTLFICKSNKSACDHFEKSLKAVNVVTDLEDLSIGKYARCTLTTPKLLEFYQGHYGEIKEEFQKKK